MTAHAAAKGTPGQQPQLGADAAAASFFAARHSCGVHEVGPGHRTACASTSFGGARRSRRTVRRDDASMTAPLCNRVPIALRNAGVFLARPRANWRRHRAHFCRQVAARSRAGDQRRQGLLVDGRRAPSAFRNFSCSLDFGLRVRSTEHVRNQARTVATNSHHQPGPRWRP